MTTDDLTDDYRGYMNNLSFKSHWPGKKGRETQINLLELETGKNVKSLERGSRGK